MDDILIRQKMVQLVALAALLSILPTFHSYANECTKTDDDFESEEDVEFSEIFERLRSCESDPSASSDVLLFLALMIGWAELDGDYPARDKQVYGLVYRAAKLGNEDALLEMPGLYTAVFEDPDLDRYPAIDWCFRELASRAPEEDTDFSGPVDSCLSLAGADASE